ncbi:MAG: AEC family transporter [Chloroflexota bacterium]
MTELFPIFANNLLPILLISGSGFLLGKFLHIEPRSFGRIIFYVLYPIMVLDILIGNQLSLVDILRTSGFAIVTVLLSGFLTILGGYFLKLDRPILMAVLLTSIFANSGNYGLPLISFAFGQEALAYASIFYITFALLINTLGVLIASMGHLNFKDALLGMLKLPTIYAIIIALIIIQTGWIMPSPVYRTVNLLSAGAIPCMLIMLGLELERAQWHKNIKAITFSVFMRLVIGPIIGLVVSILFGLKGSSRQAGITDSALPTAVITTILATEYDLEPTLVTAIVFITTVLSPLTLTPIIFFLGK